MGAFRKIRVRLYETQALKKTIVRHGVARVSRQFARSRGRESVAAVREVAGEWGRSERSGCVRQFARSRGNGGVPKDPGAFVRDPSLEENNCETWSRQSVAAVREVAGRSERSGCVRQFARSRGNGGVPKDPGAFVRDPSLEENNCETWSRQSVAAVREVAGEWGRSERSGCVYTRLKP